MIALLALLAALVALAAAGGVAAIPRLRSQGRWATVAVCLAALPFAVWGTLGPAAEVAVPLGLPGIAMRLALDPLSAFFLLSLLIVGAAAAVCARGGEGLPLLPGFVAAMMLALLAADGFALVLGFETAAALCWGLVLAGGRGGGRAGRLTAGTAVLGAVALVGAVALLAPLDLPLDQGLAFTAIREAPPAGWRAGLVLLLALVGAGGTMGLVPLHLWLSPAHTAACSEAGALMSGALTGVGAYALLRFLFDLCGAATPAWWGLPLLVLGGASAVLGALRANLEDDVRGVLAASTVASSGFGATALGAALVTRGMDLPAPAAVALGSALLLTLAHGLFKGLLLLCAGAVGRAAGTHRLARLGGLVHAMPGTTLCALVGAASLAALPISAGFAGEWLLLQALVAGARIGDLGLQLVFALLIGAVGLAAALLAAAAVRLVGVAFLSRPRTPRAAAAVEAPRQERLALAALAALAVVLGLMPALGLGLANGVVHALAGVSVPRAGVLTVGPQAEAPGYAPLGIVLLLALAAGGAVFWLRAFGMPGERRGPAWEGGGSAPPPWLPFGDPATQYGPVSFAQPLLRVFGGLVLARERLTPPRPAVPRRRGPSWSGKTQPCRSYTGRRCCCGDACPPGSNSMHRATVRRALVLLAAVLVLLLAIAAASGTG